MSAKRRMGQSERSTAICSKSGRRMRHLRMRFTTELGHLLYQSMCPMVESLVWLVEVRSGFLCFASRFPRSVRYDFGNRGLWTPCGLNPNVRVCRYNTLGHFNPHYDGDIIVSPDRRSFKTVMVYLNDCVAGGSTRFLNLPILEAANSTPLHTVVPDDCVELKVKPEAGMAIVFNHYLMHDGETVTEGLKYMMRSEVMFERSVYPTFSASEDEAMRLYRSATEVEAAGDPMQAMQLYRRAFKLCPALEYS
eukprot:c18751_g1_i2.p1 GENE.c18751_g1_i2~~c18751_g1_i2.p1  ORF type:complete len:250 (+),score=14.38 c18751_g1_i2:191-940(+)